MSSTELMTTTVLTPIGTGDRLHAILGASSADRWMNCAASVRLIAEALARGFKPKTSIFAMEGTAAHHLGELCLRTDVHPSAFIDQYITYRGEILDDEPDEVDEENPAFEIDDDMISAVSLYMETIEKEYQLLLEETGEEPQRFLEKSFDLTRIYRDMFGTNDYSLCVIRKKFVIIDYKHGRGKVVEVKRNAQMLYYALGAILEICKSREDLPQKIKIIIVQPRAAHRDGPVRSEEYALAEIMEFSRELIRSARATEDPTATAVPGSWCQFCNANGTTCHKPQEQAAIEAELAYGRGFDDLSEDEFGMPEAIVARLTEATIRNPDVLARMVKLAPILDSWIRGVEAYALHEFENGNASPELQQVFKLVRKRSNRRLKPEAEAAIKLKIQEGVINEDDAYKPRKLKTAAQLEKTALGKKFVATIAYQPPGALTLAPLEDSRQAVDMKPFDDLTADELPLLIEHKPMNDFDVDFDASDLQSVQDDWDIV